MKSMHTIKKVTLATLLTFTFSLSTLFAQNDTMYIMKAGVVVGQYNVNTEVDSVIFYKPTTSTSTTVTDIDGNVYNTVTIGTQVWMAENLKVTHYADGTAIPLVTDDTEWENLGNNDTDKAYCYYENSADSAAKYGALYTYAAAMNGAASSDANPSGIQGVCPDGWHLPSDAEWTTLEDYITADGHSGTEGTALKATSGWQNDGNGTDDYGFSALPGGYRLNNDGTFYNVGRYGYWWSSTEGSSSTAYNRFLYYYYAYVSRSNNFKSNGFSVRCLRDSE